MAMAMWAAPLENTGLLLDHQLRSRMCQTFKTDPSPPHIVSPPSPPRVCFFSLRQNKRICCCPRVYQCNFHASKTQKVRHFIWSRKSYSIQFWNWRSKCAGNNVKHGGCGDESLVSQHDSILALIAQRPPVPHPPHILTFQLLYHIFFLIKISKVLKKKHRNEVTYSVSISILRIGLF